MIFLGRIILSDKISNYILYTFILLIILYLYETKLEIKISPVKRKKIYLYLVSFLCIIFISLFIKVNFVETKSLIGRTFFKDKYFHETNAVTKEGKEYKKDILLGIHEPDNYSAVKGVFRIYGWAVDKSKLSGSKINGIFVYMDNAPQNDGKFICKGSQDLRIEEAHINNVNINYINSGFECIIDSNNIKNGVHIFYVYFHTEHFGTESRELILFVNN